MPQVKVTTKPRTVRVPDTPANQRRDYRKADSRFLMAIGAMIVLTLFVSMASGLNKANKTAAPTREVAFSLPIVITDETNGAVVLSDAKTGEEIWTYGSGEGAFARAAMRALAFSRLKQGAGPEEPMLLQRTNNGGIILFDPVTENAVPVSAFGEGNIQQFAIVLDKRESQMEQNVR